jgi:hypothetical protein
MQRNANSSLSMLIHSEGAAISAALVRGAKFQFEDLPFKSWRDGFGNGLRQLRAEDINKASHFQERFNEIYQNYGGVQNYIVNSPEYHNLKDQVRGLSTQRRLEYERFLSGHSSTESATKVLGAYVSSGDYRPWTPEDLNTLANTNKIMAEPDEFLGKRINYEGHHGRSISNIPYNKMDQMYDPDNVRLYSPKGHLDHAHEGSWKNTPNKPYSDITDRTKDIKYAEKEQYERSSNADAIIGISMGVVAGSISAIIKYKELSKSPLPWNRKKVMAIAGSFATGAATGVIPYIVINQINTPLDQFLENGLAEVFNSGDMLIQDSLLDNIADASGDFVVIMSAIAIRSLIQGGIEGRRFGLKQAANTFGNTMIRTSIEQGSFFVLQLILDSLTPIPDPVLGPVITFLRVSYGVGKITLSIKHRKQITQVKLDSLHDVAYAFFV